jgi:cytochrome c biogenesis protein CcmG, thiol:disulfide interchange protein DsbE
MNRRVLLLAPFGVVAAAGAGFLAMLHRASDGTFDPRGVPSMLMGKKPPAFNLPGDPGLANTDLGPNGPVLVNFFASWCVPCVQEASVLMRLKQSGVTLYGIAYKDKPEATAAFLAKQGDPYARIGRDEAGLVGIDWGITGVPETYLIDAQGIVRWRYVGPLTDETVQAELRPALKKYA